MKDDLIKWFESELSEAELLGNDGTAHIYRQAITALSPVLPDQVEDLCAHLQDMSQNEHSTPAIAKRLIERLARENKMQKILHEPTTRKLVERIEELEETLTKSIGNCDHWQQKAERLDAALLKAHDEIYLISQYQIPKKAMPKQCRRIAKELQKARAGE